MDFYKILWISIILILVDAKLSQQFQKIPNSKITFRDYSEFNDNYEKFSNTGINYKSEYNLRFDPRNFNAKVRTTSQSIINSNSVKQLISDLNSTSANVNTLTDILLNENIIPENTEPNGGSLNQYTYSTNGLKPQLVDVEFLPNTSASTNIMRPSVVKNPQIQSTIGNISNRLKNLFFGSSQSTNPAVQATLPMAKGLLNLFDIVKFENGPCSGAPRPLRELNGTCYHKFECDSLGGVAIAPCAGGYGVCCIFRYGCGATTAQSVTYFESPRYPLSWNDPLACTFTLIIQPYVRQVRIDFVLFELKPPINGDCSDDQFIVSGHSRNFFIPILCGINTGQHIYIDVENSIERKLFFSVFAKSISPRGFSIRLTQLRNNFAPQGCLQYYTESWNYISSFNYDDVGILVKDIRPSYFNNLNYAICIRREANSCNISYSTETEDEVLPFQILNVNNASTSLIPAGQAGFGAITCPNDFIVINNMRFCGERLNDATILSSLAENYPVIETSHGPIVLSFRTNNIAVGRGFRLLYNQEACY